MLLICRLGEYVTVISRHHFFGGSWVEGIIIWKNESSIHKAVLNAMHPEHLWVFLRTIHPWDAKDLVYPFPFLNTQSPVQGINSG
jgi:hypothetical protein